MKYFKFFVLVFVALGICHLRAMPSDVPVDREKMDKSVELIVARLPLHVDDPLKELEDTEEEEAFDYIRQGSPNSTQMLRLAPIVGEYCAILQDFPFGYPKYDGCINSGDIEKITERYKSRINWFNKMVQID